MYRNIPLYHCIGATGKYSFPPSLIVNSLEVKFMYFLLLVKIMHFFSVPGIDKLKFFIWCMVCSFVQKTLNYQLLKTHKKKRVNQI